MLQYQRDTNRSIQVKKKTLIKDILEIIFFEKFYVLIKVFNYLKNFY